MCVILGAGESGVLVELAPGTWTQTHTHTQLRCIPVLIKAGNKAVLLKKGGKNRRREEGREEEDGNGEKGRKKREILNFNNTGTIL